MDRIADITDHVVDHRAPWAARYRLVALTPVLATDAYTLATELLSASLAGWEGSPDELEDALAGIGARLANPSGVAALAAMSPASGPATILTILWDDRAYDAHLEPLP